MAQPIKNTIKTAHPNLTTPDIYTLIIDGTNLLKISMVDTMTNSRGEHVGGIFQFLLQVKLMLQKKNWDFVYVMWDGDNSGVLRYKHYPLYKANRDKEYNLSDYDKQINDYVNRILAYSKQKENQVITPEKKKEREDFDRQRQLLWKYLEELCIRQVRCDDVEGDDLIAYYVNNKKNEEKIVIMSADRDYLQLINDKVIQYIPTTIKDFVTFQNHTKLIGYPQENALLKKILLGDASDNIKGVKGLGEKTLYDNFPEFKTKPLTLADIQNKAKLINEERINKKLKPLKVCENIVNGTTDGCQEKNLYEINDLLINLKNPLLTEQAKEDLDNIMYNVLDPEDRSFQNLYKYIIEDDITELIPNNKFISFFSDFKRLYNKEIEYYNKNK